MATLDFSIHERVSQFNVDIQKITMFRLSVHVVNPRPAGGGIFYPSSEITMYSSQSETVPDVDMKLLVPYETTI